MIIEKPDYDFSEHTLEEVLKNSYVQFYLMNYYYANIVNNDNRAIEVRFRNLATQINKTLDLLAHILIFYNIDVVQLTKDIISNKINGGG